MKRWMAAAVALLLLLAGYVAAGPYLAVQAIRKAVAANDAAALSRQVDFPALRTSLKLQLDDRIVREAGPSLQSSLLGALGLSVASGVAGGVVDAMVTPTGLGALMEGRKVWDRVDDGFGPAPTTTGSAAVPPEQALLRDPRYRFESPSRFTATALDASGRPLVFVMTRQGLRWRLADIRLPPT